MRRRLSLLDRRNPAHLIHPFVKRFFPTEINQCTNNDYFNKQPHENPSFSECANGCNLNVRHLIFLAPWDGLTTPCDLEGTASVVTKALPNCYVLRRCLAVRTRFSVLAGLTNKLRITYCPGLSIFASVPQFVATCARRSRG